MKLTDKVQNVGLHDYNCKCYVISKKEAQAAIDLIKAECIKQILKLPARNITRRQAIQAVESIK